MKMRKIFTKEFHSVTNKNEICYRMVGTTKYYITKVTPVQKHKYLSRFISGF